MSNRPKPGNLTFKPMYGPLVVELLRAGLDAPQDGDNSRRMGAAVGRLLAKARSPIVGGQALGLLAWHHAVLLRRLAELDPTFDLDEYLEDMKNPTAARLRHMRRAVD